MTIKDKWGRVIHPAYAPATVKQARIEAARTKLYAAIDSDDAIGVRVAQFELIAAQALVTVRM